ncbi:hypothetical protein RHMOL_Rhmol10G0155000 [Rhododendron molle]|uniref:Uncharacterized protein n=1 Tax=Rhododendron molle TaxID=49168 RepID=A0ACC0M2L3_RHOML|nr:hypothetical protein RHMOL_Rhmol10G0155000 [Rhododendron molle]
MASSSFSHSPSSNHVPIFHCGKPAPLRMSNIPSSMGRRFYGCGSYPVSLRDELLQTIDRLEKELEKSKAEQRRQRGMFVATWVAIFCFMVLYLTK